MYNTTDLRVIIIDTTDTGSVVQHFGRVWSTENDTAALEYYNITVVTTVSPGHTDHGWQCFYPLVDGQCPVATGERT